MACPSEPTLTALRPAARSEDREARIAAIVERIRRIPPGRVQTYGGIDPKAPRLVGQVLATTRLKLPWHRVMGAGGKITLPMARHGKEQRRRLLREGVEVSASGRVDLARFGWNGE